MNCTSCPEKERADYWHQKATRLMSIIGGEIGGVVAYFIIRLFGN